MDRARPPPGRDWVASAVYLAATVMVIVAISSVPANTSITGLPGVTMLVLLVVAPVHTVLAFSPAAKVPTWRDVFPAWVGKTEQPVMDAVPLEDRDQDRYHGWAAEHGIVVRRFDLAGLYPRLRELLKTETDPWVQHDLAWYLDNEPIRDDDPWELAALAALKLRKLPF